VKDLAKGVVVFLFLALVAAIIAALLAPSPKFEQACHDVGGVVKLNRKDLYICVVERRVEL